MTPLRRRGATSATTLLWVALCLVGFTVLALWTVDKHKLAIQADIEKRSRAAVVGAPGLDLRVEADGRDVTVHGRVGSNADRAAVVARLVDVEGVRQIEDALQHVPGLEVGAAGGADEGWGDALPAEAQADAQADAAPASTDAWGTNRPREATGARTAAKKTTKKTRTRKTTRTTTKKAGTTRQAAATPRGPSRARDEVGFAAGSTGLGADAQAAISAMARRAAGGGVVHVYGHADDAGSAWANHDLSNDRADRVARALRAAGVPARRVRAHGAGDQYPLGPAGSPRNRRVELALHGSGK